MPELTAVVCTYNRAELLAMCLESLAQQTLPTDRLEVVIVDNNSTDDTAAIADRFATRHPHFRVVHETAQGLSHARNRGWREATGTYVAFIDDDARAEPEWAQRVLDAFETVEPCPTAVGGEIHPWYATEPPAWFADELEIRSWGPIAGFLEPPRARTGLSGSNMAFPRRVLEEHRGFSPDFGMVGNRVRMGDETELFGRLWDSGANRFWYDPAIRVRHWTGGPAFSVLSRVRRGYAGGQSRAAQEASRMSSARVARTLSIAAWRAVQAAMSVARQRGQLSVTTIRLLNDAAYRVGLVHASLAGRERLQPAPPAQQRDGERR